MSVTHPFDPTAPIYVARTKHRQEQVALRHLAQQGYRAWPERVDDTTLMPRHILIQPRRSDQSLAPVRSTRGISELIYLGAGIAVLRPSSLAALIEDESFSSMEPQQRVLALLSIAERDTLNIKRKQANGGGVPSPI